MVDNSQPISPADTHPRRDTRSATIAKESLSRAQDFDYDSAQEQGEDNSLADRNGGVKLPPRQLRNGAEQMVAPDQEPFRSSLPHACDRFMDSGPLEAVTAASSQDYQSMAALASEMAMSSDMVDQNGHQHSDDDNYNDNPSSLYSNTKEDQIIKAFAMLKFEDAVYYMQTYTVILGRDEDALKEMRRRHRHGFPFRNSSCNSSVYSGQVSDAGVSIVGGIIGCAPGKEPRSSKSKTSTSARSSSYPASRRDSIVQGISENGMGSGLAPEQDAGAVPQRTPNPFKHELDPDECPIITIHPPAESMDPFGRTSNISRKHAKIAYNPKDGLFKITVMGKNGLFINDKHHGHGEQVELKSHDSIQIGGVRFEIYLARGETGVEDAMSLDFEDDRGELGVAVIDTSGTTESSPDQLTPEEEESQDEVDEGSSNDEDEELGNDEDDDEEERDEDSDDFPDEGSVPIPRGRPRAQKHAMAKQSKTKQQKLPKLTLKVKPHGKETSKKGKAAVKQEARPSLEIPTEPNGEIPGLPGIPAHLIPPRRKGPGRPPKNGIMSKREQAQIIRQQKELAKAEGIKNGTIKPGKTPSGDLADVIPEKRKYTKRKKPGDQPDDAMEIHESIEGNEEGQNAESQVPRPPKEKRPPKPPRSPSPVFDEATLTPEQLAKPAQSYVVLIHEALSQSPTGQMSLPQIYRAIERRYPYYKLRVTTQGWQSSVRHNLSQHNAFCKIEREGKGWMWGLVPDVAIDKEKKKRPSPPAIPTPNYYPQPPQMYRQPPPYQYQGNIPPAINGQGPPPPGQHPYMYHPPPPGHGYPPGPPGMPRTFNGLPLPFAGAQNGSSTYQSPYTSSKSASALPQGSQQPQTALQQSGHPQGPPGALNSNGSSNLAASVTPNGQVMRPSVDSTNLNASHSTIFNHADLPKHILDAVDKYKAAIMQALADWPNIEDTVTRVINRTLGIHPIPDPSTPKGPQEETFEKELKSLLGSMLEKHRQAEEQRKASIGPGSSEGVSGAASQGPGDSSQVSQQTTVVKNEPTEAESTSTNADAADAAVAKPNTTSPEAPTNQPEAEYSQSNPPSSSTPLQDHQQTPILNLLQKLGHKGAANVAQPAAPASSALDGSGSPKSEDKGDENNTRPLAPSRSVERAQAHAISASREAADKVINALGVGAGSGSGSKRVLDEGSNQESGEEGSEAEIGKLAAQQDGDQPRVKRVAV